MNLEECNTKTQRHEGTKSELELLVNFGAPYVKDGVSRIINGILPEFPKDLYLGLAW